MYSIFGIAYCMRYVAIALELKSAARKQVESDAINFCLDKRALYQTLSYLVSFRMFQYQSIFSVSFFTPGIHWVRDKISYI